VPTNLVSSCTTESSRVSALQPHLLREETVIDCELVLRHIALQRPHLHTTPLAVSTPTDILPPLPLYSTCNSSHPRD
jgi:hypothetical protein